LNANTDRAISRSAELAARNSEFYDTLWSRTYLTRPQHFNTWSLLSGLLPAAPRRLEVGPGLRPRLPIAGTNFVDTSRPAVERLNGRGGYARIGKITALPCDDGFFSLVVACDVIEHVEDDRQAFGELSRVLRPDGVLVFSVPLHPEHWTVFDACVGHARRYRPAELRELLDEHGLVVEKSAVFGMQPNNPRVLRYTVRALTEFLPTAIRWYNWLFLPLGILFQKRLKLADGLIDLTDVHEVLLVCRRGALSRPAGAGS
jgi:SAM-dependent methyltransferase